MEKNVTKFESLPNEILFEIGKYFSAQELQRSFFGLNRRFHLIIDNLDDLHLTLNNTTVNSPFFFSLNKVTKLTIDGVTKNFDFYRFPNVRSLTWHFPCRRQIEKISLKNPFPQIEYFRIGESFQNENVFQLYALIFSGHFEKLHTCHFGHIRRISLLNFAPLIRTLTVGLITEDIFRQFLMRCPNLTRFAFDATIFQTELSFSQIQHENLSKLRLEGQLNYSKIEIIFQLMPNLIDLQIDGSFRENSSNFLQNLTDRFDIFLRQLQRFRFRILLSKRCGNFIEQISNNERFHPCLRNEILVKELDFNRLRISNF